jgi:hypothetical protein
VIITKEHREYLEKEFKGYSLVKEFLQNTDSIGPILNSAINEFRRLPEEDRFEEMENWINCFEIAKKKDLYGPTA